MATQPGGSVTSRAASESRSGPSGSGNVTGAKFRHGLLQLMIHTIDPLHDGISSCTLYFCVSCASYHFSLYLALWIRVTTFTFLSPTPPESSHFYVHLLVEFLFLWVLLCVAASECLQLQQWIIRAIVLHQFSTSLCLSRSIQTSHQLIVRVCLFAHK